MHHIKLKHLKTYSSQKRWIKKSLDTIIVFSSIPFYETPVLGVPKMYTCLFKHDAKDNIEKF